MTPPYHTLDNIQNGTHRISTMMEIKDMGTVNTIRMGQTEGIAQDG